MAEINAQYLLNDGVKLLGANTFARDVDLPREDVSQLFSLTASNRGDGTQSGIMKGLQVTQSRMFGGMEALLEVSGNGIEASDLGDFGKGLNGKISPNVLREIMLEIDVVSGQKLTLATNKKGEIVIGAVDHPVGGGRSYREDLAPVPKDGVRPQSFTKEEFAKKYLQAFDSKVGLDRLVDTLEKASKNDVFRSPNVEGVEVQFARGGGNKGDFPANHYRIVELKNNDVWHINNGPYSIKAQAKQVVEEAIASGKLPRASVGHVANDAASIVSKQAGAATTEHLVATSGLAAVGLGAKAFATHMLPPVLEGVAQVWSADEVVELAKHNLQTGHLTQAQFNIISDITKQTVAAATAVSMAPDPTGLTSDKAVQLGDQNLVAALEKSGLSKQQAEQYQMGSMTGALDKGAQYLVNRFSNDNEVKQEVALNGSVPLSMALNVHPDQLKDLGAMSEKLGGNALQAEVARSSDFAQLAHLTPKELSHLGSLAAAGIDPNVTVSHDKISMLSQQPALSTNAKTAFEQAVTYIVQSGDSEFRAPKNADPLIQGTIKNFAELYTHLSQDGGLSKNDIQALSLASKQLASGIEQSQQTQLAMH